MIKRNQIFFLLMMVSISYTIQAQSTNNEKLEDKDVEIIAISAIKNSDTTKVVSLDTMKAQFAMNQIINKNIATKSVTEDTLISKKEPRIEMFSKPNDSVKKINNR